MVTAWRGSSKKGNGCDIIENAGDYEMLIRCTMCKILKLSILAEVIPDLKPRNEYENGP
jgi:hypothetical protein